MRSASTRPSRFSITSSLSETLAPPRIATNGMIRGSERLAEIVDLGRHQESGGGLRDVVDDAFRRRVRAMRRSERVVHVDVRKLGQRLRERRIVLFLFGVEPQVLEQDDAARIRRDDGRRGGPMQSGANATGRWSSV